MIEAVLFHPLAMLAYGLAAHGATIMAEYRSAGEALHPCQAIRRHPWRTSLSVIGALTGYGALSTAGQITAVSAFAVGYMGSDVLKRITTGTGRKLEGLQ